MNKTGKVTCKKVLGQTICKVGSAVIVPKNPVTVTIYNSKECDWCNKEIKAFKKRAGKLDGLVHVNVKDVEDSHGIDFDSLGVFPVAVFGTGVVHRGRLSKMEETDIVSNIIEATRNDQTVRSFNN